MDILHCNIDVGGWTKVALSEPVNRVHRHTRGIEIKGYEREDGLWDMEGVIHDYKPGPYGHMEDRP